MKKILLIALLFTTFVYATKYQVTNIQQGGTLNVRDFPLVNQSKIVGKLYANTININVKECTELVDNSEWCYIYVQRGASYVEGWVNSYYLREMSNRIQTSKAHIQNFLHNFYMADEEDYMDKLQVFYSFPMQRYQWSKNVSLMNLRAKKVREYKKWTKRDFRMTYLKILKRKSNYIDVQTTVRWHVQSHDDYQKGKDIQKLRLVPTGNTFKVAALKNLKHIVFPKPKPTIEENTTIATNSEINETLHSTVEVALETSGKKVATNSIVHGKFYIKSGSFFSEINPTYLNSITQNGFPYVIQKVQQGDKIIRRVFIGPFDSIHEATQSLSTIRAKINEFAYIQTNISK
jgi:hypothetical protein